MPIDPYERLANAIILYAVRDYRSARRRLRRHVRNEPSKWLAGGVSSSWQKWDTKKTDILNEINSLKDFFYSEWFMVLSDVDGPSLFEKLKREADADEC